MNISRNTLQDPENLANLQGTNAEADNGGGFPPVNVSNNPLEAIETTESVRPAIISVNGKFVRASVKFVTTPIANMKSYVTAGAGVDIECVRGTEVSQLALAQVSEISLGIDKGDLNVKTATGVKLQASDSHLGGGICSDFSLSGNLQESLVGRLGFSRITASVVGTEISRHLSTGAALKNTWDLSKRSKLSSAVIGGVLSIGHGVGQFVGAGIGANVLMPSEGAALGGLFGAASATLLLSKTALKPDQIDLIPLKDGDAEMVPISANGYYFMGMSEGMITATNVEANLSAGAALRTEPNLLHLPGEILPTLKEMLPARPSRFPVEKDESDDGGCDTDVILTDDEDPEEGTVTYADLEGPENTTGAQGAADPENAASPQSAADPENAASPQDAAAGPENAASPQGAAAGPENTASPQSAADPENAASPQGGAAGTEEATISENTLLDFSGPRRRFRSPLFKP